MHTTSGTPARKAAVRQTGAYRDASAGVITHPLKVRPRGPVWGIGQVLSHPRRHRLLMRIALDPVVPIGLDAEFLQVGRGRDLAEQIGSGLKATNNSLP